MSSHPKKQSSATKKRIYADNAATSYPKPHGVSQAVADYIERVGASAGRGAYREALESRRLIDRCRDLVRQAFGLTNRDHVIFTLNGSDALNIAIKGAVQPGDHVITTAMDHNSVLRPLAALHKRGEVEFTVMPVDAQTTRLDPASVIAAIKPNTKLVAVNHASNVTGVLQPLDEIGAACRERDVLYLVDGAQSAGHVPINLHESHIDLLAMPGHKGLLGPLGTGVLLIREGVEQRLQTWREGGTGSVSEQPTQPASMPDKFEAGSHNAPGIAGLAVSVAWLLERGVEKQREHELQLINLMLAGLAQLEGVELFGPTNPQHRVGVFSLRIPVCEPHELASLLENEFGILSRAGLHCAPHAHQTIDTLDRGGTTRLSFGPTTSVQDVDAILSALRQIATSLTASPIV